VGEKALWFFYSRLYSSRYFYARIPKEISPCTELFCHQQFALNQNIGFRDYIFNVLGPNNEREANISFFGPTYIRWEIPGGDNRRKASLFGVDKALPAGLLKGVKRLKDKANVPISKLRSLNFE